MTLCWQKVVRSRVDYTRISLRTLSGGGILWTVFYRTCSLFLMRTTTQEFWDSASYSIQSCMRRYLLRSSQRMHLFQGLSTLPQVGSECWTARQSEHLASRQSGLQQLGQWGLSSNPVTARSRFGEQKAVKAEADRTSERFGAETAPIQFCSARSQVRECCSWTSTKLYGGGTGVRVGHRPPWCPEGTYVPKEGECFKSKEGQAGIRKRSYRRAMSRLGALGFAKYRGRMIRGTQSFDYVSASKQALLTGYQTAGRQQGRGNGGTVGTARRLKYAVWNCGASALNCTPKYFTGPSERRLICSYCKKRTGAAVWTGRMQTGVVCTVPPSAAELVGSWCWLPERVWMRPL